MHLIIWSGVIAGFLAIRRLSPGQALLWVYVPVLLLFPDTFHAITPGLPDPSANVAVMMPIFLATMARYGRYWAVSFADCLVIAIVATMTFSEFLAAGYSEAQNLGVGALFQIAGPYLVARLAVDREGLHVALAKRIVLLLLAVALIGLYEFRFGWNPWLKLPEQFIFHGQGFGWVTTFRHGFARVAGPYAHCILAGMMMIMGYRLNRWLEWGGHWEREVPGMRWLPVSKGRLITLGLLLGSLTTIARGPWLGGLLAAVLVNAGRHPKRKLAFGLGVGLLLVVAVPGYVVFQSYLDIKPGAEMTMSQETALYRKELFQRYYGIALDHAWLGWGRNTWPKVPGMASIDNYYLLLSLMHGLLTTGLLVGLIVWMSLRLFIRGMTAPLGDNSLAFTFLGIIAAFFVALVTVYLGENVLPAFFLLLGWAEAYLQGNGVVAENSGEHSVPARTVEGPGWRVLR